MTTTPQVPEEESVPPATMRYISSVLQLARQEVSAEIASAIREFKRELETAQRDQERKESSQKSTRELEWTIRIVSCLVVAVFTLAFAAVVSQCSGNISDLRERLSALESKEGKKSP
jgi:DNA topoisomerase VI subunit B